MCYNVVKVIKDIMVDEAPRSPDSSFFTNMDDVFVKIGELTGLSDSWISQNIPCLREFKEKTFVSVNDVSGKPGFSSPQYQQCFHVRSSRGGEVLFECLIAKMPGEDEFFVRWLQNFTYEPLQYGVPLQSLRPEQLHEGDSIKFTTSSGTEYVVNVTEVHHNCVFGVGVKGHKSIIGKTVFISGMEVGERALLGYALQTTPIQGFIAVMRG